MNEKKRRHIRYELRYSYGTYLCTIGDYAIFRANIGWTDESFIFAKKCRYGIIAHQRIYEDDTEGMRLYHLNDSFARLIGYENLPDMMKRLPSIQYHRRFISLKAIDRATVKSGRKKRQRSGRAGKIPNNTNTVFNNIK